jgi:hypothetical protein
MQCLNEKVCEVQFAGEVDEGELALTDAITEPMEACVNALGAFLLDDIVAKSKTSMMKMIACIMPFSTVGLLASP